MSTLQRLTLNGKILVPKIVWTHFPGRFISTIIDSVFGVNYPCLLNLEKPVAHYNSGGGGVAEICVRTSRTIGASTQKALVCMFARKQKDAHRNTCCTANKPGAGRSISHV